MKNKFANNPFSVSTLITKTQERQLLSNHAKAELTGESTAPVVKWFSNYGRWIFSEYDGQDRLFGLCDLGIGMPEAGWVSISELIGVHAENNMLLERDLYWRKVSGTNLSDYARAARREGHIVDYPSAKAKDGCVVCGESIKEKATTDWIEGHNAQPLASGQCCDECNEKVVQARVIEIVESYGLATTQGEQ